MMPNSSVHLICECAKCNVCHAYAILCEATDGRVRLGCRVHWAFWSESNFVGCSLLGSAVVMDTLLPADCGRWGALGSLDFRFEEIPAVDVPSAAAILLPEVVINLKITKERSHTVTACIAVDFAHRKIGFGDRIHPIRLSTSGKFVLHTSHTQAVCVQKLMACNNP